MRILQTHNKYRNHGGEDAVLENERILLEKGGFMVEQALFDNKEINPLKTFYNVQSYKEIKRKIKVFKPDIMHVHNIFYTASPSVLKAANSEGVPVVMTLHNFRLLCPSGLFLRNGQVCLKCKDNLIPYHGIKHKCFQDSYAKSVAIASFLGLNKIINTWGNSIDKFIVLTPFIKNLILTSSLKINEDKIIVKANSTDDVIEKIDHKSIRNGYLFVGRLSKEKGVDLLVDAFNKTPEHQLEIIGSGDLSISLKARAQKNIIFHGLKDREFIQNKLAKTRALIFPSVWYEGLPNTIIEAYSSGTPVIASDIDNINQLVSSGFNGETFKTNDVNSLVEKINAFSNKETASYQINARSTFEKAYTHEINFQNLQQIYSNLL